MPRSVHQRSQPALSLRATLTFAAWLGLGLILASAGLAKVGFGHKERFLLPAPAYYAVAFMEIGAALLLFMPTLRRPVLSFVLCLAVAGSMATWLSDALCGCFGGLFESDWRIRALSSSSLGILSLLLLLNQPRSRMELEEHNTIEDAHHA
jgi:hypothetical protein